MTDYLRDPNNLDPTDPAAYDWLPPAPHAFVDAFAAEVAELAAATQVPVGFITEDGIATDAGFTEEPVAYDGFGAPIYAHQLPPDYVFPLRFIAGMDPADVDPADLKIDVMWQIPAPMTITRRYFPVEVLELIFGGSVIPLCDRQLPAEGQE